MTVEDLESRIVPADTVVRFDNFSATTGLVLNGSAETVPGTPTGTVLRLADAVQNDGGSAFSQTQVNASQFSTFFVFRISNPGGVTDDYDQPGADGIAFVVQPVSSSLGGIGNGIGYAGIPQSVAVELDTFGNNGVFFEPNHDPSSNHVGITTDGNPDHGEGSPFTQNVTPDFDNGQLWYAWVDYNGTTLEVRVRSDSSTRPTLPTLTRQLDVPQILGQSTAFIGFTAATGAAWGDHDIVRWEYRSSFDPITTTPEAAVFGNGVEIADGDTTPAATDRTDFGSANVGSPVTRTFTVRNTGQAPLTTSGLSVPAGFTVTEGLAASIPAGGQDTFTVRLNATAAGTFQGNISFANNDANENPYNFAVRGVVQSPASEVEVRGNNLVILDGDTTPALTDFTDFGAVNVGAPVTRTFTVRNTGQAPLTTSGLVVPAGFTVTEGLAASIPAGGQDTFTVRLNATAAGTFQGNVTFGNNDANENPYNFAIRGVVRSPLVAISGRVYNDVNANGHRDVGEAGLGLFTVYLDADNDGVLDSTERKLTTDIFGNYSFTGLAAGTYRVRVVAVTGLAFTQPTGGLITRTLTAGQSSTGNQFGVRTTS